MTVSGTHPAFPSAPAVRAKAEKGEMADIYTLAHTRPSKISKKPPQSGLIFFQKAEMWIKSFGQAA